jgi:uncharacterized protein YqjF (DUF2071 family)
MAQKKFLTAEWRKLIMANYIIDPSVLIKYLPAKTEIDLWNGQCYISLVGFLFQDVRVKGIRVPCHVNFPEVNLRFYVRYLENNEWKRGVVFISEIVPKPAITFIANTLYKEHYESMPMKYSWKNEENNLVIDYQWKKKKKWNKLEVKAESMATVLQAGSCEEFITEHFWGYSAFSKEKTGEYHVVHPRWDIYSVQEYTIDCDFESLYGNDFSFLADSKPDSVFLAEGSAIAVFQKRML